MPAICDQNYQWVDWVVAPTPENPTGSVRMVRYETACAIEERMERAEARIAGENHPPKFTVDT